MYQKFIARIEVKAWNDTTDFFQELPLSKGHSRSIEIISKEDDNGLFWTVKVTATLRNDIILLHNPCIMKVRLLDRFYIIGTPECPAHVTVKEDVLTELTLEYKTKSKPKANKKVLSIAPECD